jgi:SAM-dependent methyltransferase
VCQSSILLIILISVVFSIVQTRVHNPEPPGAIWQPFWEEASSFYSPLGRYAHHFARGKLRWDPVFRALLVHGLIPPGAHVLDIGCGQALVASLLMAVQSSVAIQKPWPQQWACAPTQVSYTGLECMPQDCHRAQVLLSGPQAVRWMPDSRVLQADMRDHSLLPSCNVALLLDVLHYVNHAAQELLLQHVHQVLVPGGRLLIRAADARKAWRFGVSQWLDRCVALLRGLPSRADGGRSTTEWQTLLQRLGFEVETMPMSQGTPFANVLLMARKKV